MPNCIGVWPIGSFGSSVAASASDAYNLNGVAHDHFCGRGVKLIVLVITYGMLIIVLTKSIIEQTFLTELRCMF